MASKFVLDAGECNVQRRAQAFSGSRRYFIGGSDARIIVGDDEAALLRLWRVKRMSSMGQTGQSEAIHSPDEWHSRVVTRMIPAS
jgi:hypothetical protein